MPDVNYYLKHRQTFLLLGRSVEVKKLDIHYKINLLYSKEGRLIKIIQ